MEQIERKVVITESGQQMALETRGPAVMKVYLPNDEVKQEVALDVTDEEFEKIQKQAMTNKIPAAILRNKKVRDIK